jgi:hypothetical protein
MWLMTKLRPLRCIAKVESAEKNATESIQVPYATKKVP